MGIRASYWVTGGILTVLGLAVARVVLAFLGGLALTLGLFLLKAGLVALVVLVLWLAFRRARTRRDAVV